MPYIEKENKLLRPKNLHEPSPGKGFQVFSCKKWNEGWSSKSNGKCIYEKM